MKLAFSIFVFFYFIQGFTIESIAGSDLNLETDSIQYKYALIEGVKYLNIGKPSDALSFFKIALKYNKRSSAACFQIANIYFQSGDNFKALDYCRRAVRFDLKNETYLTYLSNLYIVNERIDSAIMVYEGLVKYNPHNYGYKIQLVSLYIDSKKFKKSLKYLNYLETTYGLTAEIFIAKYQVFFSSADYLSCYSIIRKAISVFPDEPKFYHLLASQFELFGKTDSALFYYHKVLDLDSGYEEVYSNILDLTEQKGDFDSYFELLDSYMNNRDFNFSKKISIVQALLQNKTSFVNHAIAIRSLIRTLNNSYPNNISVLSLSADHYIKSNNFSLASKDLTQLISLDSSSFSYWSQLVFVFDALGEYSKVIDLCQIAVKQFPEKSLLYLYQGMSFFQLRKYEFSVNSLLTGLRIDSSNTVYNAQFYVFLGESYNSLRRYDSSDIYFNKYLLLDSSNLLVLNNYSYYLSIRNVNLEKALRYSYYCIAAEPRNYTFLDTYGWILFKLNRLEESKKFIENAILNGGYKNSEILEHYCEVLFILGDRDEAIKYYKMILDLGKQSEHLQNLLLIN